MEEGPALARGPDPGTVLSEVRLGLQPHTRMLRQPGGQKQGLGEPLHPRPFLGCGEHLSQLFLSVLNLGRGLSLQFLAFRAAAKAGYRPNLYPFAPYAFCSR